MENEVREFWHEKLDALEVGKTLPVDNKHSVYSAMRRLDLQTAEENLNLTKDKQKPYKVFSIRAVSKGSKEKLVIRKQDKFKNKS